MFAPLHTVRFAFTALRWSRGLRACLVLAIAMTVSRLLGMHPGWPALGALQTLLVDNGGPYRSRWTNFLLVMVLGTAAVFAGIVAGRSLALALLITIPVCFALTFARVCSQALAATGVINLVSYVVAYGSAVHSTATASSACVTFVVGSIWAAAVSLAVWPADPFRPARMSLADALGALRMLVEELPSVITPDAPRERFTAAIRLIRTRLDMAQSALAATPARMTSRTVRSRNLTALAECADLLLARVLQAAEIAESHPLAGPWVEGLARFLDNALGPLERSLRQRPEDLLALGSGRVLSQGLLAQVQDLRTALEGLPSSAVSRPLLERVLEDSRLNVSIALDAAQAVWTGTEPPLVFTATWPRPLPDTRLAGALSTLRAHWTFNSVMFRHAVRLTALVALDVVLMQFIPVTHGYWLAMTAVILLQPFSGETVRRAVERVGGTIAGALVAAVLAALIQDPWMMIGAVSAGALFAVSAYGAQYAAYCFFLTPTIVLLALPHPGDWEFAAIRAAMTLAGAATALVAMLLWPERESLQAPELLARCAAAEAAYLRAVIAFWREKTTGAQSEPAALERAWLAPARRSCGLAASAAEETLDHALLERDLPLNPHRTRTARLHAYALTFVTYVRRLTQTATAAALLEPGDRERDGVLLESLALRLDKMAALLCLPRGMHGEAHPLPSIGISQQPQDDLLRRVVRQVEVLEQSAVGVGAALRGDEAAHHDPQL